MTPETLTGFSYPEHSWIGMSTIAEALVVSNYYSKLTCSAETTVSQALRRELMKRQACGKDGIGLTKPAC